MDPPNSLHLLPAKKNCIYSTIFLYPAQAWLERQFIVDFNFSLSRLNIKYEKNYLYKNYISK